MVRITNSETQFVSSDNTKRQATPIPKKTLTGEIAFKIWLNLAFKVGEKIWLKFSHNQFLTGTINQLGNFPICETRGSGTNRRKTAYHADAFKFLSQRTTQLDGGAFYIPGKPGDYPLKEFCPASDDIGGEMDDGTALEQWERIELLVQLSGLTPGYIIGSGGKSAHPHWKLSTTVDIAQRTFFARMLAIALLGDPAVTNPHQPMRVPGFYRKEKGKEQTLEFYSEARYSPEEFEQGMQRCFVALNFTWYDSLSQDRWQEVRRVLSSKLPRGEKEISIRQLLALPESDLPENVRRRELTEKRNQRQYRRTVTGFIGDTANSLIDAVTQTSENLGADAFYWTGHNWQWTGNKARGCCPWHESTTGTAGWIAPLQNGNGWGFACPTCTDNKQLNAFGYWWHFKNGINAQYPKGKEWAAAAKEFCQQAGVDVPELQTAFANDYSRRDAQQEQFEKCCARHTEQQQEESLKSFFINGLGRLKKYLSRTRPFVGFGPQSETKISPEKENNSGIIKFAEGQHQQTIESLAQEAKASGKKLIILDNSSGGTGKSHLAGELTPQGLGIDKLFYTSSTHRNPTVASIERNYADLPVRNDGLFADDSKRTPLNNPSVRWPQKGEQANLEGNCFKAPLFYKYAEKGYRTETSLEAGENPLCLNCKLRISCIGAEETDDVVPGSGFRWERRSALAYNMIRCSLDSLPDIAEMQKPVPEKKEDSDNEENIEEEEDTGKDTGEARRIAIIVDELTQFHSHDSLEASLKDFDTTWMYLQGRMHSDADEDLAEALKTLEPIVFFLRQILNGEEKTDSDTRNGWSEAILREKLGELLISEIQQALETIRRFTPKLEELLKEADSVSQDSMARSDRKGSAASLKYVRNVMQKEADKENRDAIANMPSNWLVPLLEILLGEQDGSFRIQWGKLIIYTNNDRHRDHLKQADFTLILDGTENRKSVAQKLKCDPSEIVVIQQKVRPYKNLVITQVTGFGLLGADRSASAQKRVNALTAGIERKHESVGVIDHKGALDEESEAGYWFKDNRGSNRFQENSALVSFGTPFQNIGHLQMLYTTLTGDRNPDRGNANFDAFVQEHVQNEMQQAGWRLRSTRRPDEQLYWYIASDADLSYLKDKFPGAEFETKPAFQITPDAGSASERIHWSILQAFKVLDEAKQKVTTGALAKIVGCHRSRISQIANEVAGGFDSFRKVLIHLLSTLYRGVNTLGEPLTEDEQFAAKTYLPLLLEEDTPDPTDLVNEAVAIASSLGWKSFARVLAALDPHHRSTLLGNMLIFLPEEWQQELLEIPIQAIRSASAQRAIA
ncbi:MAG: RepB family DNA primase [Brasilonema angustatum HA4187-MV1]|jgi:hypothetical protein|nr:RepB family DNA primase [Brasilonema angustatum HA4187-MV1]